LGRSKARKAKRLWKQEMGLGALPQRENSEARKAARDGGEKTGIEQRNNEGKLAKKTENRQLKPTQI
jgi:hypothetical protein